MLNDNDPPGNSLRDTHDCPTSRGHGHLEAATQRLAHAPRPRVSVPNARLSPA